MSRTYLWRKICWVTILAYDSLGSILIEVKRFLQIVYGLKSIRKVNLERRADKYARISLNSLNVEMVRKYGTYDEKKRYLESLEIDPRRTNKGDHFIAAVKEIRDSVLDHDHPRVNKGPLHNAIMKAMNEAVKNPPKTI